MDVSVIDKNLTEITFQVDGAGDIIAMHAGVTASVSYDGSTGNLSSSVDIWPLLNAGLKNQMGLIKAVVDQAVSDL